MNHSAPIWILILKTMLKVEPEPNIRRENRRSAEWRLDSHSDSTVRSRKRKGHGVSVVHLQREREYQSTQRTSIYVPVSLRT
uniref:Uncharacterized protein n=1 Tax=Arundo donax TaxID=35708 RepID=A0A0A9GXB1_ARUDO